MSETNAGLAKKEEPTVAYFFKLGLRFSAGSSALLAVYLIIQPAINMAPFCIAGLAAVIWTLAEEFK